MKIQIFSVQVFFLNPVTNNFSLNFSSNYRALFFTSLAFFSLTHCDFRRAEEAAEQRRVEEARILTEKKREKEAAAAKKREEAAIAAKKREAEAAVAKKRADEAATVKKKREAEAAVAKKRADEVK